MLLVCMLPRLTVGTGQQIGVLFPEKTTSLTPSFRVLWTFSMKFGMFIGILLGQVPFGKSHWEDFMGIASAVRRRPNLTAKSSGFYSLSSPSFTMFHEPQVQECFVDVCIGTGLHSSAF